MSNWIVVPLIVFAYLPRDQRRRARATATTTASPISWERRYGISTSRSPARRTQTTTRFESARVPRAHQPPKARHRRRRLRRPRRDRARDQPEEGRGPSLPQPRHHRRARGWKPANAEHHDSTVRDPGGAVVSDVLLQDGADLIVEAPDVTIRRVKLEGGSINNFAGDRTATTACGRATRRSSRAPARIRATTRRACSATAAIPRRRVEIWHRVGGIPRRRQGRRAAARSGSRIRSRRSYPAADAATGTGTASRATTGRRSRCATRRSTSTSPVAVAPRRSSYPSGQGNTSVDIDGLLVKGGGAPFRLGMPGTVSGLRIVNKSWAFCPVDVNCSALGDWDGEIVEIIPDYQIARGIRPARCEGEGN